MYFSKMIQSFDRTALSLSIKEEWDCQSIVLKFRVLKGNTKKEKIFLLNTKE